MLVQRALVRQAEVAVQQTEALVKIARSQRLPLYSLGVIGACYPFPGRSYV